ncbi:MAG TPA: zinc ribbon domain-containing protein, partial [Acidimicrobiales bacterium]|nr:zinc ribbon domain-containing protein [Acidimicrobiales bacterium]
GMLRCRACGGAYFGAGTKGRNGFYRYYACRNRQTKGTYGCRSGRLPAEDLETAVIDDLLRMLSRSDLFEHPLGERQTGPGRATGAHPSGGHRLAFHGKSWRWRESNPRPPASH